MSIDSTPIVADRTSNFFYKKIRGAGRPVYVFMVWKGTDVYGRPFRSQSSLVYGV